MLRLPPRSTRTATRLPYTTLCRSNRGALARYRRIYRSRNHGDCAATDSACLRQAGGIATGGMDRDRCRGRGVDDPGRQNENASPALCSPVEAGRSEEHTSELQSLMRNSYAVFCLKQKNDNCNTSTETGSKTT